MKKKSSVISHQSSEKKGFIFARKEAEGFTLIEILVAISIMAVVFGVITSSIAAIGRRSRDQQRITDLQNIQAALAQYHADQQFYPASGLDLSTATQINDSTGNPFVTTATKVYLNNLPQDPSGTPAYCYRPQLSVSGGSCDNTTSDASCGYYLLCAQMEGTSNTPSLNCKAACGPTYDKALELNPNQSGGQ